MWNLASKMGTALQKGAEKVANNVTKELGKLDLQFFGSATANDLHVKLEEEALRVSSEEQAMLMLDDWQRGFEFSDSAQSRYRYPVEIADENNVKRQVGTLSFQTIWLRSDAMKILLQSISEHENLRRMARTENSPLRNSLLSVLHVQAVACGVPPEVLANLLSAAVGTGPAAEQALSVMDMLKPGPEIAALLDGRLHLTNKASVLQERSSLPEAGLDLKAIDPVDVDRRRVEVSSAKAIMASKLVRVQKLKLENLSRAVQRSKEELSLLPSRQKELRETMSKVTTDLDLNQKTSCERESKLQNDKKGISEEQNSAIATCSAERATLAEALAKLKVEEEDLLTQIKIVQKRMVEVDTQIREVDQREAGIMDDFTKQDRQFQRNMQKEADVQGLCSSWKTELSQYQDAIAAAIDAGDKGREVGIEKLAAEQEHVSKQLQEEAPRHVVREAARMQGDLLVDLDKTVKIFDETIVKKREAEAQEQRRGSIETAEEYALTARLESLLKHLALLPRDARRLLNEVKGFLTEEALARMERSVSEIESQWETAREKYREYYESFLPAALGSSMEQLTKEQSTNSITGHGKTDFFIGEEHSGGVRSASPADAMMEWFSSDKSKKNVDAKPKSPSAVLSPRLLQAAQDIADASVPSRSPSKEATPNTNLNNNPRPPSPKGKQQKQSHEAKHASPKKGHHTGHKHGAGNGVGHSPKGDRQFSPKSRTSPKRAEI